MTRATAFDEPAPDPFKTLQTFQANGTAHRFHSLPALAGAGLDVSRLPVSIRLVLESLLRNCDGKRVAEHAVRSLATWKAKAARTEEIPFVVARIVLQDFTGVPLLVDLAAMRSAVARTGQEPEDHRAPGPGGSGRRPFRPGGLLRGAPRRLRRTSRSSSPQPRALPVPEVGHAGLRDVQGRPPGIGIVHQVNLEFLAKGLLRRGRRLLPGHARRHRLAHHDDQRPRHRRLGRRRHRGRGGHARPARLFPDPRRRRRPPHRRAARGRDGDRPRPHGDAASAQGEGRRQVRRILRAGRRRASRGGPRDDRQHGPRIRRHDGILPDRRRMHGLPAATGRSPEHVALYEAYYKAQGLWGVPKKGEIDYSQDIELDLGSVVPSVAGPKRPQDRIELPNLKREFVGSFSARGGERVREKGRGFRSRHRSTWAERPRLGQATGRARQRADRRHHELHQHLQPLRHAGRRPPGEEGGGAGAQVSAPPSSRRSRPARGSSPTT
jgi:aconitate hydratase